MGEKWAFLDAPFDDPRWDDTIVVARRDLRGLIEREREAAARSALEASAVPPTWCGEHHAWDHCEDDTLAALEASAVPTRQPRFDMDQDDSQEPPAVRCGNCGADLSKQPTNGTGHVCLPASAVPEPTDPDRFRERLARELARTTTVRAEDWVSWLAQCPEPNVIAGIAATPPGPHSDSQTWAERHGWAPGSIRDEWNPGEREEQVERIAAVIRDLPDSATSWIHVGARWVEAAAALYDAGLRAEPTREAEPTDLGPLAREAMGLPEPSREAE